MRNKLKRSLTLLELLIAMSLLSVLVLSFHSLQLFSHRSATTSDKQALLQNELSLALEHMSKNVQQGVGAYGAAGNPPRRALAARAGNDGFIVFTEPAVPTPLNPADDTRHEYVLSANTLSYWAGGVLRETLSRRIRPGVVYVNPIPDPLPANPAGFYINFSENFSVVEIVLVARFIPGSDVSLDNPQIALRSRLYARSASAR